MSKEGLPQVALKRKHNEEEEVQNLNDQGQSHSTGSGETTVEKKSDEKNTGFGSVVAAHYNNIEESGFEVRNTSKIFYLRNFNNWIKSLLIKNTLKRLSENNENIKINVLDVGCGKGGDLFKWRLGNISHLVCADIADSSVEQCQIRYNDLEKKFRSNVTFTAEFIAADCTKEELKTKFQDPSIQFDLISCQFSFHYCFESLPQAECMLMNISQNLKVGGYFIGTIPDSNDIVKRLSDSNSNTFGNSLFRIQMNTPKPYPLFGAAYDFYLEGVVNCPEFLVHFPTMVTLCKKYNLELVLNERFDEYYKSYLNTDKYLLEKMKGLETYPPVDETKLNGNIETGDYDHVKDKQRDSRYCGTMSKSEWEACSLYQVFVFKKV